MKFCFRPTDAPEKERLYICDFSHGRLNVRLSARIQPLLRGHKYRVFSSLGSVFGDTKGKKQPKVKKWVDKEYETGRVTAITDSELEKVIKESSEKLGINF